MRALIAGIAIAVCSASFGTEGTDFVATNCTRLAQIVATGEGREARFALKCVTVCHNEDDLTVLDQTSAVGIALRYIHNLPDIHNGDCVNITGFISCNDGGDRIAYADKVTVMSHGPAPNPRTVTAEDFTRTTNDFHLVTVEGTVRDIFLDETDPRYFYLVLLCKDGTILSAQRKALASETDLRTLINARLALTGICQPRLFGNRRFLGRTLQTSEIAVLQREMTDPFDVPKLEYLKFRTAAEISSADRHRTTGRVLVTWNGGAALLLKTDTCGIVMASLCRSPAPRIGETVEIAGFPACNIHFLNLENAIWRTAPAPNAQSEEADSAMDVNVSEIMTDDDGRPMIHPSYHGRLVRLTGTVRSLANAANKEMLHIEANGYLVPVDLGNSQPLDDRIAVGCEISAAGICVMDIENRNPATTLPRIRGFVLMPRSPSDIVLVSQPPWLTRGRLLALAGGLAFLLFGMLVWNRSLHALARRHGHELYEARIDKVSSELRVGERTRLAVELHDSLAQNLTGVSMEIEAAERSRGYGIDAVSRHLSIADKALKSCRAELRNSLWDLRSQALEKPDVDSAIRQTLVPHVKNVKLVVRFNVPREKFSDNTLHEILRIIRELVINGVRHGKANEIKIAGAIEGDRLLFSVTDNGCGFDPDDCPGVADGHFGLQGIGERLENFAGSICFTRLPGKGMKASVTIPLPRTDTKENANG